MHATGIALFLFAAAVTVPNVHYAVLPPPPRIVSPDPAPPHPLKPRDPETSFRGPLVDLARVVGSLAKGALRDHGH